MKITTLEEKSAAMAMACGWARLTKRDGLYTELFTRNGQSACLFGGELHKRRTALKLSGGTTPDYPNDPRTKEEILAVMTEAQKRELICLYVPLRPYGWTIDSAVTAMQMDHPTFFDLAGKAMGLWE